MSKKRKAETPLDTVKDAAAQSPQVKKAKSDLQADADAPSDSTSALPAKDTASGKAEPIDSKTQDKPTLAGLVARLRKVLNGNRIVLIIAVPGSRPRMLALSAPPDNTKADPQRLSLLLRILLALHNETQTNSDGAARKYMLLEHKELVECFNEAQDLLKSDPEPHEASIPDLESLDGIISELLCEVGDAANDEGWMQEESWNQYDVMRGGCLTLLLSVDE